MDNQGTLKKQKEFIEIGSMIDLKKETNIFNPDKYLLDENFIAQAIWECLKENDPEGVIDILQEHFKAKNKSNISKTKNINRSTIYHCFRNKNPSLNTLAKLIHATIEF